MMTLLDIRFSFICRTTHTNEHGKHPIVLRIAFRNRRKDIFTGLSCLKDSWNSQQGRLHNIGKEAATVNKNLDHILRKANDAFDALRFGNEEFSIDELIDKIKGKEQEPELLLDYLEKRNQQIANRVGVEITKATYYKYRRSLQYVQEFLLKHYRLKNYTLKKINLKFLEDYFHFLRVEKNVSHNVARRYIEFVKTILQPALHSGIIKNNPFRDLRIKSRPVIVQYLSQDEIDLIMELKTNDPDLERKKDIFLFACFTGLAYVDIKGFKSEHLSQDADGTWFIRKSRQKTGEQSIIPLLPAAVKILQKYSSTGDIRDFK